MKNKLGMTSLAMLLMVFTFSVNANAQSNSWSDKDLLKATCEIAFSYYDNNLTLMASLIDAYGDPVKFNQERIEKIQMLMAYRNSTAQRMSKFQCDADFDEHGAIVMHGSLQLDSPGGVTDISLDWGFIVEDGRFTRIVLDETVFENPKIRQVKQYV